MKMNTSSVIIAATLFPLFALGQSNKPDTVVVELASSSKVTFTMQNKDDLMQLKQYDYQALFDDILKKLEKKEASSPVPSTHIDVIPNDDATLDTDPIDTGKTTDSEDNEDHEEDHDHNRYPHTRHFFNIDFGLNNYFENGTSQTPGNALYTVHPWGSWYIGLNAVHHVRFSRNLSLDGSVGISWYNFKFDVNKTMIAKNEDGIVFQEDTRDLDFTKSKLTTSYLNASIVPVFNTGNSKRDKDCGYCHSSEFRIGAGAYAGYRLISYAKQQFKIEGETKTDRTRDNYFMQNIRYGLRLQIGIHDLDFFFNYDLNKIFEDGKGPGLNAYSFGLTF